MANYKIVNATAVYKINFLYIYSNKEIKNAKSL